MLRSEIVEDFLAKVEKSDLEAGLWRQAMEKTKELRLEQKRALVGFVVPLWRWSALGHEQVGQEQVGQG